MQGILEVLTFHVVYAVFAYQCRDLEKSHAEHCAAEYLIDATICISTHDFERTCSRSFCTIKQSAKCRLLVTLANKM